MAKRLRAVAVLATAIALYAQTPNPSSALPGASMPDAQQVLDYLGQTIDWHRNGAAEDRLATDPADLLYRDNSRRTDLQILQLAFDFARADAQLLAAEGKGGTAQASAPRSDQSLAHTATNADQEVQQLQGELAANQQKLRNARGARQRKQLQALIGETKSELDLAQTRSQTLHDLLQFVAGVSGNGGNLQAQVEQLQRSIPELQSEAAKPTAAQTNPSDAAVNTKAGSRPPQPSGLLGLGEQLFALHDKMQTLKQRIALTDSLARAAQQLRSPVLHSLTAISQQGDQLAKQADVSNAAQLEQERPQLDALNNQFKQVSSVALPLAKQITLFDLYKNNLSRWREGVKADYDLAVRHMLLRLVILGIVVVLVLALSEVWRRAAFRYVHDMRRRYQILLLRRIVLWCLIGIAIAFSLASEIGSIATFAGLITAGIAVAMQNVILAIAGYFFLIGKYGVKVGDRVQISGVTGDVIDIGLIRLHLMEIGGQGTDQQATGRIVVFSNSVVFQPSASFFKQFPGTHFFWHAVSLTLAPDSDYHLAEKRMLGAVDKVYSGYREDMEAQHRSMEETLNMPFGTPAPKSRLRLTQNGLEIVIRYPINLEKAAEIDDAITRELLDALEQSPRLKLVGTGTPNIQSVPEEPKAA